MDVERKMDTGRSWLVLLAVILCVFIDVGLMAAGSVYFVIFRDYFQADNKQIVLIMALPSAMSLWCGPVSTLLYETIGCRISIMTGGVVSSMSLLLASCAQNTTQLLVCFLLFGIGQGIKTTSQAAVLTQYFDKYQQFALGMFMVCGALGQAFAWLIDMLCQVYTWRGAMVIQAGIALQYVVLGALTKSRRDFAKPKCENFLPLKILKEPLVLAVCLLMCTFLNSIMIYYNFIIAFMIQNGISSTTAALLVSISAAPNFIGRLITPFLAQNKRINNHLLAGCFALSVALVNALVPCCNSVPSFMVNVCFFGIGYGCALSMSFVVVVELFGPDRLPKIMSVVPLPMGISLLILPRIAGLIADNFGLQNTYYMASALAGVAAVTNFSIAIQRMKICRN